MKTWNKIKSNLVVWWSAQKFSISIKIERRKDVFGKTYRHCYHKYGHAEMLDEYLNKNSWEL